MSTANYNVSFICFPLITLVASVRSHHTVRTTINDAIAFALGLLLGFLPQLLTWRILFGGLTIPYAGQLDWLHPRIMEVLFSTSGLCPFSESDPVEGNTPIPCQMRFRV